MVGQVNGTVFMCADGGGGDSVSGDRTCTQIAVVCVCVCVCVCCSLRKALQSQEDVEAGSVALTDERQARIDSIPTLQVP